MTDGFQIQDPSRRHPTVPQRLLSINPVWFINSKKSTAWRRSDARGPDEINQPQISLVNRTRRVTPRHDPTLRRPSRHLQVPLVVLRPGAKTSRAPRRSRHLPLISTLSHLEPHQTSTDRHTLQPLLPPGAPLLHLLIFRALEPLLRLQGRGT